MKKILVLLAHPQGNSFNHAIYQRVVDTAASAGHEVIAHDLYAEGFEPTLPQGEISRKAILPEELQRHCKELVEADGIVIIHPNWWGQPPAVLKGWIDRVIRPGVAYEFIGDDSGEGVPKGLLKARFALVLNTSNTSQKREQEVFGDPLETIWQNCIFGLCGVTNFHRHVFRIVITSSDTQRKQWLDQTEQILQKLL